MNPNADLAAEALVASMGGVVDPKPLTVATKKAAEGMAAHWQREVVAFMNQERPDKFKLQAQPEHEPTLDKLTRDLDLDRATEIAAGLVDSDVNAAFMLRMSEAREFLRSNWPSLSMDTPTGEVLLEPNVATMGAAWALLAVVERPTRLLEEMRMGTLTGAQAEAVKAVYPVLFDRLRGLIDAEIKKRQAKRKGYTLPWAQERVLRVLFGMPVQLAVRDVKQPAPRASGKAPNLKINFEKQATAAQRNDSK